jgi:hypothetical protein
MDPNIIDMDKKLNFKEAHQAFLRGDFESPQIDVQKKAGWAYWFCEDNSLPEKTKKIYPLVKKVYETRMLKGREEETYVILKNILVSSSPFLNDLKTFDGFNICEFQKDKSKENTLLIVSFPKGLTDSFLYAEAFLFKGKDVYSLKGPWDIVLYEIEVMGEKKIKNRTSMQTYLFEK